MWEWCRVNVGVWKSVRREVRKSAYGVSLESVEKCGGGHALFYIFPASLPTFPHTPRTHPTPFPTLT